MIQIKNKPQAVTAQNLLPLLRKAVRAKVEMYNAIRAIEKEVLSRDVDTVLDDSIEGLAFNCDTPEDVDSKVNELAAAAVLDAIN